jgi:phosphate starvation-inducible PhoH-like protein
LKEVIIPIEFANAVDFYGVNDGNIDVLRRKFPALKIVARGNEIKLIGEANQTTLLETKLQQLIDYFKEHSILTPTEVEFILSGRISSEKDQDQSARPTQPQNGEHKDALAFAPGGLIVKARTPNQRKLVTASEKNDIVFAIGPAGTGKTYTAVALAVRALKNKEIRRIILTRPAVEAGENLGFLPGDMKEKLDPYMQPLYDALRDMIPPQTLEDYILKGIIQIAPLAFMRGRTLDNAFVILDEAQNTTHSQMKMFLTRMGKNAKFIITGDPGQVDLPRRTISGLKEAILVLKDVEGIGIIYLDDKDIVRHRLVKKVIDAYKSIENND